MNNEVEKAIVQIEKRYGKGTIAFANKFKGLEIKRIPTGSISLDIETGGGFPKGRIVEIFGELSSGKSALALKTIIEAQKLGLPTVWVDAEGQFSEEWAKKLGVDTSKLLIVREETAEKMLDIADALIRTKCLGCLVLDSVACLMPYAEEEVPMEDPERLGDRAMMMNRFMRKLHSALNLRDGIVQNECLVILLNQTREKVGVTYGNPETTTGGKGIGFSASIRLHLRRADWIKSGAGDDAKVVGQTVKFRTVKNKTYPPYRVGEFDFYFDDSGQFQAGDIDRIKEVILYSVQYDLIKQGGAFYTFGNEKWQGKEKMIEYFRANPKETIKLREEILNLVLKISKEK